MLDTNTTSNPEAPELESTNGRSWRSSDEVDEGSREGTEKRPSATSKREYKKYVIYALGDSYTTTSVPQTPRTGTYAGGNNWITYFIDVLRILLQDEHHHRHGDTTKPPVPTVQLFNYAKCGDVFSAGYITEASSDLRGAAGRGAILRGEDGKEGQWGELIKEIEGERVLGKARGNWGGKDRPVRSLFAIWIGVNDLAIMCDYPGVVMKEFLDGWFAMYKAFLADKLIGVAGAREILILNLPPMDKLPTELNASDKDEGIGIRAWVDAYNTRLRRVIDEIQEEHSDKNIKIPLVDTWKVFTKILDEPRAYNFFDATSACGYRESCNSGGNKSPSCNHVWKDGYHPTEKTQVEVGKEVLRVFLDNIKLEVGS